jgi:CheY-like chemotaxis protein
VVLLDIQLPDIDGFEVLVRLRGHSAGPAGVLTSTLAVFPDGRATSRLRRVFIVANYATTVPLAFVQLVLVDPARLRCSECPTGRGTRITAELPCGS